MSPENRRASKVLHALLVAFDQASFRAQPRDAEQRDAWAVARADTEVLLVEMKRTSRA